MNPYLRFGLAGEPAAWAALIASAFALFGAFKCKKAFWEDNARARWLGLTVLGAVAALLSFAYLFHYLRGGPRIVDAAYYYLQARTLSLGQFTFSVPDPVASFNGRFLLQTQDGLGVLFPPGYAAALATAFRLEAPLSFGPLLAAALVFATYWLARELGASVRAAFGAAALGVLSAALRYHTADTMSHGWAALLSAITLAAGTRATGPALLLSGFCGGWLFATRPVTGAVVLVGTALLARRAGWKILVLIGATLPGLLLLFAYQHALTGHWLTSTQLAYYALADGPPGCFRYGFGSGIGCWFEHGDFVRARLPEGYGAVAAVGNTLRRLGVHALDIGNAAPLALLVPYGAWLTRKQRAPRIAFGVVLGVILGYAPFYFEASYPGGGARLFADVLPIEHVFVAWALSSIGWLRFAWPVSLIGFAMHTHLQHAALRDREGGRPMFKQETLDSAGLKQGLVFVSTDHGFALGHDPRNLAPTEGVVVARRRGDALDRLLWERLGRPSASVYTYEPSAKAARGELEAISAPWPNSERIEAENLWPPVQVQQGWAHPAYPPARCTSGGRGLRLRATGDTARVALRLPNVDRPAHLVLGWLPEGQSGSPVLRIRVPRKRADFTPDWNREAGDCWRSKPVGPLPAGGPLDLVVEGSGVLDYIELAPSSAERR